MTRRPAAVTVLLAILVAGCGGEPEEERVRERVTEFGAATAAKDYDRLCDDLFAPELLETVKSIGLPCRLALEQSLSEVEDPRLVIGAVRVDGDRAEVDVRSSAAGQAPSQDTLALVKEDGEWRITDLDTGGEETPEPSPTP